jgi:predicted HTH domain antitoxin
MRESELSKIQLEIPDAILISLKETPEGFSKQLLMAAAVKLYELGKLSSGRSAELADMSRVEFMMTLGRYQVSPFLQDSDQLEHDSLNA